MRGFCFADSDKILIFARMFRNKDIAKFLSTLFLGVYLFVALFAQGLHQHNSPVLLKFAKKDTEKTFSKETLAGHSASCIWCHFLSTGHSVIPAEFPLAFSEAEAVSVVNWFVAHGFNSQSLTAFYLRGPPVYAV